MHTHTITILLSIYIYIYIHIQLLFCYIYIYIYTYTYNYYFVIYIYIYIHTHTITILFYIYIYIYIVCVFFLSEVGQVRLGLHGDLLSGFRTAYVEVYLIYSSICLQITIFYVSGVLNIWCAPIERNIFYIYTLGVLDSSHIVYFKHIRGLGFKSYSLFQAHVRLCAYLVR